MENNLQDILDEIEGWIEFSNNQKKENKIVKIVNGDSSFNLELYIDNSNFQYKNNLDSSFDIEKTIDELEKYITNVEYSDIENISEKQRVLIEELGNNTPLEVYLKA